MAYSIFTTQTNRGKSGYTAIRSFSAYALCLRLVCIGAMQSGDQITALSGSGRDGLNDRPYGHNILLYTSKHRFFRTPKKSVSRFCDTLAKSLFREPVALNQKPLIQGITNKNKNERIDKNSKKIQTSKTQGADI